MALFAVSRRLASSKRSIAHKESQDRFEVKKSGEGKGANHIYRRKRVKRESGTKRETNKREKEESHLPHRRIHKGGLRRHASQKSRH